jgi:hypothetical protein
MTTETMCCRCGRPTGRTARNAIYCIDCACKQHRERLRRQKRVGGSRAQFDRMMAAWRDGTIARVLEATE